MLFLQNFYKKVFKILLFLWAFSLLFTVYSENNSLDVNQNWTDEAIIELWYVPWEIVVVFDEKQINLSDKAWKREAQSFTVEKSSVVANKVASAFKTQLYIKLLFIA